VETMIVSRIYSDQVELLDTFNAANNLPDLLFALISGGALAMAFIPLLTEYLTTKSREAAWDLFSRVANFGFLITGVFALLVAIFAQQIVDSEIGIAPGFGEEQRILLAQLMRMNLIATMIFSISGLVMASLQANQHFVMPAIAPIMYNVGHIFGAIFLVPRYGIYGLVYGVIIGAALHLLVQFPMLFKFGFRWTPALDIRHTGLIEALKLMAPRLFTMAGIQLIFIARDNLASRLDQVGAVTSLTYGWMIMQVPETILGTALATALLPTLSELASKQDWKKFSETVERSLRVLIALTLPIAAVMSAGINPLVRGVFGFDESISSLLTWTTRAYLATLTGYVIHEVAVRAFYARKEPMIPLYAVIIRLVLFLGIGILGISLFPEIGAPIIAIAELALLIEAIILLVWLSRRTHEPVNTNTAIIKGLISAVVGGVVTYLIALYLPGGAIVTALIGMIVGGLVALIIVWSEAKQLFNL
ncbi:MAG TPA: murein biosynthesis integral membrane protein MurJ, partial [Anaerolineales bacterium]|nr:murein biosynthesis integral membrane protein MurJ [Anaerolineales bacterium]